MGIKQWIRGQIGDMFHVEQWVLGQGVGGCVSNHILIKYIKNKPPTYKKYKKLAIIIENIEE